MTMNYLNIEEDVVAAAVTDDDGQNNCYLGLEERVQILVFTHLFQLIEYHDFMGTWMNIRLSPNKYFFRASHMLKVAHI